ncbi:uncharacterized protein BYT42DRAFT_645267 [Radiomyces spectabilis]|uniref:uncharacterized protein n=1 Tax=Radiomyces spectabilis TaxID=64574 RepID=UPI00221FA359|nr:uncharacterized protein BYT42DRAFT_645267 [Radiomyces spectabilis]KAI8377687.1 hypothetical protein BYT42DRAFT_645267 [Radiomyces spectabilis]
MANVQPVTTEMENNSRDQDEVMVQDVPPVVHTNNDQSIHKSDMVMPESLSDMDVQTVVEQEGVVSEKPNDEWGPNDDSNQFSADGSPRSSRASTRSVPSASSLEVDDYSETRSSCHYPDSPRTQALAAICNNEKHVSQPDHFIEIVLDNDEKPTEELSEMDLADMGTATLTCAESQLKSEQMMSKKFSRTTTHSLFSVLSAPSKISRSTTQQYLYTPSIHGDFQTDQETLKQASRKENFFRRAPSRRGICNTMSILAVVSVIVFLFAGYPLSLYISKEIQKSHKKTANV